MSHPDAAWVEISIGNLYLSARIILTVMRLHFVLPFCWLFASGKDKTMFIPKTPADFDYDLWTTEDGKYMVRLKRTGEVTEVSHETMKYLRAEEKRVRRSMQGVPVAEAENEFESILSLSYVSYENGEGMEPTWLEDPVRMEDTVMVGMLESELLSVLTLKQRDVYEKCLIGGMKLREYAALNALNVRTVFDSKTAIQKKFKKIWMRYSTNE